MYARRVYLLCLPLKFPNSTQIALGSDLLRTKSVLLMTRHAEPFDTATSQFPQRALQTEQAHVPQTEKRAGRRWLILFPNPRAKWDALLSQ